MGNVTAKTSGDIASFMTPAETNIKSLKVHFSPKQLGEGDPSPENVREIVGWDGVEVAKSSINLLDQSYITEASGWILSSDDGNTMYCGVPVYKGNINKFYTKFKNGYPFIGNPFKENVQYNVSAWLKTVNGNSIQGLKFGFKYTDGTTSLGSIFAANDTWKRQTVTSKANKTVSDIYCSYNNSGEIYLCGLAVCEKEFDDINIVHSNVINNISIDWLNDIGTVYGGYVDLISGELVEEYYGFIADGENIKANYGYRSTSTNTAGGGFVYIMNRSYPSLPDSKNTNNIYCDKLISKNAGAQKNSLYHAPNGELYFVAYVLDINEDNITTSTEAKDKTNEWLKSNPLQIIYELKTPITHQLTPTQLQSFVGQNNFWSNADYVEIEYELKETEDIQKARKKIILNQPHTESATGDIASFTTNMKAPLKECKVYFEPIQESEGDPSPDNVRNITGWDGIDIFKTSNIIIPNDVPSRTDKGITWTTNEDGSVHVEGTSTSATWYGKAGDPMHYIKGNVTYKLSGGAENVGLYLVGKNLDGTGWSEAKIGGVDLGKGKIFTLDQDAYVRWQAVVQKNRTVNETIYPKLTIIDTNNFEPYQGTTTSVSWSNEIGTVYGGYIDLVTGELVSDMAMVEFDGSSDENWQVETLSSGLTNYYMYATSLIPKAKGNQRADGYICSNMCIPRGENETYTSGMFYFSASGALNVYLGGKSNTSTVAEFKTWLTEHKLQIAYWLAEPIHYQLTPQQLLTLKGENNIWSDTNGQTEVKFWTH